jgi:hypothetical protein
MPKINFKMNQWLEGFKKSQFAWSIVNELLYENADVETISFASQTLRRKILGNFSDLPTNSYDELLSSIIQVKNNLNYFYLK